MTTPRQLVDLFTKVSPDPASLFSSEIEAVLASQPELAPHFSETGQSDLIGKDRAIVFALRCLSLFSERENSEIPPITLVGTFPGGVTVNARSTRIVVREMLEEARSEIIIFGFEISEEAVVKSLAQASVRARVTIVLDRSRDTRQFLLQNWPAWASEPRILTNRERASEGKFAKMHSKAIIVDGKDLLITSANLTFHGFRENIELGLRVQGESAREARTLMDEMLNERLLEPASETE